MTATDERPLAPARPRRPWLIVVAALAVVAGIVTVAVVIGYGDHDGVGAGSPAASSTAGVTSAPGTTSGPGATSAGPSPSELFGYQPLWPFPDPAAVTAWQQAYRGGGQQPWHLDAEATALAFTTGYLGFTGVDVVVSRSITGSEALVGVGYRVDGNAPGTAAVLHLARYGSGADAPWEVVGTKDSTFSLTRPGYGAAATSPLPAGGRITGVDENIRVQVRHPGSAAPLGEFCCQPAGGDASAWSATVEYGGAAAGAVLTVVASTGGHVADVERFAVTAVRT